MKTPRKPIPFLNRFVSVAASFWRNVERKGPDECWSWKGPLLRSNRPWQRYGNFGVWSDGATRSQRAHRFSWMLANGPIPEGLNVLHRCDNTNCVNPNHLFVGTQKQNVDDQRAKGRLWYGERNGRAKLTEDDVRAIRASTERTGVLAKRYGVHWTTLKKARDGTFWPHVN